MDPTALNPGEDLTLIVPKLSGMGAIKIPFNSYLPLWVRDIGERVLMIQKAGRTPRRLFLRRGLYDSLGSQALLSLKGQYVLFYSRPKYSASSSVSKRTRRLWGVPITWTKGREPYYLVDDKGNRW